MATVWIALFVVLFCDRQGIFCSLNSVGVVSPSQGQSTQIGMCRGQPGSRGRIRLGGIELFSIAKNLRETGVCCIIVAEIKCTPG